MVCFQIQRARGPRQLKPLLLKPQFMVVPMADKPGSQHAVPPVLRAFLAFPSGTRPANYPGILILDKHHLLSMLHQTQTCHSKMCSCNKVCVHIAIVIPLTVKNAGKGTPMSILRVYTREHVSHPKVLQWPFLDVFAAFWKGAACGF